MAGERFGIPLKKDICISIGFGTPYSGAFETNYMDVSFHILGVKAVFRAVDAMMELKSSENHNNLFVTDGIQMAYTIPFGNFFEIGYLSTSSEFSDFLFRKYTINTVNKNNIVYKPDGSIKY